MSVAQTKAQKKYREQRKASGHRQILIWFSPESLAVINKRFPGMPITTALRQLIHEADK